MKDDELAREGIKAFQSGNYQPAVKFLSELIDRQPSLWTCRLYLAMSYKHLGSEDKALEQLSAITERATDQTIKRKALDELRSLNPTR